ncbi:hypothetical protein DSM112329_00011 [Paraconexibacter sp. AEG42_29]|uniref:CARDB domain-containing protein n=1 Tax=Paraconexibacter sp. AEG42_29 TaxID=2997339 RepID=A0AAU7APA0_9ACTN
MSFFDDEPTRAAPRARPAPRPRKPADAGARRAPVRGGGSGGGSGPRSPGRSGGSAADDQTLLVRRLVAGGGGLLVLILLVLGVNGCLNSRKDRALKDYTRNVATVLSTSQTDVALPFFQLLNVGADNPSDLTASVRQYALAANEAVKQANGFDVPDDMVRAQNSLMLVLHLRATAISKIADKIADAQAKGRDNAAAVESALKQIAGQMRAFDASDVIYTQRVRPYILDALKAAGVSGPDLPAAQFLPDIGWLDEDNIAGVLNAQRAEGGTGANPEPKPGLHGHGLISVAVGDTVLAPSPATNRPAVGASATFNVKIANQGDNDETDVIVRVSIKAGAAKAVVGTRTVASTKSKTETVVPVTVANPPTGNPAILTAEVVKVPGEKTLDPDNNKQTYTVLFSR